MTETEDDIPKHQKRAEKSKPWLLECRVHPDYRKCQTDLMFLSRDWWTTSRYKTEERANQAKADADKSQNHGYNKALFFEYRVRKS